MFSQTQQVYSFFTHLKACRLTRASSQGHISQEDLWPMALVTNGLNMEQNSPAPKYGNW